MTARFRFAGLLVIVLVATLASACAGKSINHVLADPSRYRNDEVKVSGTVVDSYSIGNRGIYHLDDGTGRLWVTSEHGVPRRGARVSVWGTIRDPINLGALGNLVKLPINTVLLVEREHRAR